MQLKEIFKSKHTKMKLRIFATKLLLSILKIFRFCDAIQIPKEKSPKFSSQLQLMSKNWSGRRGMVEWGV